MSGAGINRIATTIPVRQSCAHGDQRAIMQNGDWIYLTGNGASPEGDRPFLDRFNLQTLKSERIFRSEANSYEAVVALLSDDARTVHHAT